METLVVLVSSLPVGIRHGQRPIKPSIDRLPKAEKADKHRATEITSNDRLRLAIPTPHLAVHCLLGNNGSPHPYLRNEIAVLSPDLGSNSTLSSHADGTGIGTTDRVHTDLPATLNAYFPRIDWKGATNAIVEEKSFAGEGICPPPRIPRSAANGSNPC